MKVEFRPVPPSEQQELWRDLQEYIQGMTAYDDSIERVDGEFRYPWFEHYWRAPDRWSFWALADGNHAGFALVRRDENGEFDMAEFYIRPQFRRGGIGLKFARMLLQKFPGTWSISEYRANTAAVAFWHKVIAPYSFTEEEYLGEDSGKARLRQQVKVER